MQQVQIPHGFYYPDSHDVSLSDIAATLIAHERLFPVVIDALENLFPGLTVEDRKLVLEKLERSSLNETFFAGLFIAFQKDLETEVPAAIEALTGHVIPDRYDTIVTVLFMIAIYYGTTHLFKRFKKTDGPAVPVSITGDYATYIQIAAAQAGQTEHAVVEAIEKAVGKKRLALVQRAAIDLFRPAKRNGDGRILPRGLPAVSALAIADFPSAVAEAELEDDVVPMHLPRARLMIRATDRDKSDTGWAGKIETDDLKTKRLPVRLAPGVDPDALAELHEPKVEALIESRIRDDGSTKPVRIHVYRIL